MLARMCSSSDLAASSPLPSPPAEEVEAEGAAMGSEPGKERRKSW